MVWLVAWIALSVVPAWSEVPDPAALSCVVNSVDQCKEARFQLPRLGNDGFAKMFETRRPKFTEWIRPMALYVQGVTGLPASVFIGQAGVASDWGATPAFRNNNNIFKHMCWVPKSTLEGEIQLAGHKFSYKGTCGVEKTFGQIGRPFKFATREESVLAYLHFLFSPNKQYKALQEELKRGIKPNGVHLSGYKPVSSTLGGFSHDPKYLGILQNLISVEKLPELDAAQACWQCLLAKSKEAK